MELLKVLTVFNTTMLIAILVLVSIIVVAIWGIKKLVCRWLGRFNTFGKLMDDTNEAVHSCKKVLDDVHVNIKIK